MTAGGALLVSNADGRSGEEGSSIRKQRDFPCDEKTKLIGNGINDIKKWVQCTYLLPVAGTKNQGSTSSWVLGENGTISSGPNGPYYCDLSKSIDNLLARLKVGIFNSIVKIQTVVPLPTGCKEIWKHLWEIPGVSLRSSKLW